MAADGWIRSTGDGPGGGEELTVTAGGAWTIGHAAALDATLQALHLGAARRIILDLSQIDRLDSAGAWLLNRTADRLRAAGADVAVNGVSDRHAPLLALTAGHGRILPEPGERPGPLIAMLERTGRGAAAAAREGLELLNFVGMVTTVLIGAIRQPRRLRPKALVTQIEQTGLNALPIVGLLSFLVGIVLAYLMSDQLRQFGAEVFTVNLIGLSILREVAVLITAIMIAGRSGSAFTAQIGTMKVNEEVDAMGTLGLNPIEVLVLPRVLALILTLPILTFFADIMGILGGGVMTVLVLDLTPAQFVSQLQGAVTLNDFLVGIVKAPVHAYIIAIVGCYEGLKVQRTAESVGRQTTVSVVESIFLVIVATALFSVFFSVLGI